MGVYLPIKDYSAMQGPAPEGFHVPTNTEWQAIYDILITTFGLSKNDTTMGTYLKMPRAGARRNYDAAIERVGQNGRYWSSIPSSNRSRYLFFSSSNIDPQTDGNRAYGNAVRCFKDTPTMPTSSWTTLYDGSSVASGAGIFWDSTNGLISVSGDGQTWYTIMDKNLGATTVFNQGDTLTDANCGYFYQWGNNYGFAHSGTVTTSSTQVDASNYGPGNYYNSSTFILRSSSPLDWSSVQNDNLWGGVTGVKPTSLKNAYIGEYVDPYDLLSDVIVYYDMNGDITDRGPNGWDLSTVTGSYAKGGDYYNTLTSFRGRNTSGTYGTSASFTLNCWYKNTSQTADGNLLALGSDGASGWGAVLNKQSANIVIGSSAYSTGVLPSALSGWNMLTEVFDYSAKTLKLYKNAELMLTKTSIPNGNIRGGSWIQLGDSGTAGNITLDCGITFATQNTMTQTQIQAFYDASKGYYS